MRDYKYTKQDFLGRISLLENNQTKIMEKLDDLLVEVAKLPEKIFEKCDERYCKIETQTKVDELSETVSNLKGFKMWLTGAVAVLIFSGGTISYLFAKNIINEATNSNQIILSQYKKEIELEIEKKIVEFNQQYNLNIK